MDRALQQFLAVAEDGTVVGAAATLGLSQPALTYALKKLEQTLGAPLFVRSSRGVQLTAAGETLYEHAVIMRRLYGNAVAAITRQRTAEVHGIAIGSGYTAWTLLLQDLMIARGRAQPDAPISVSLGSAVRLMDQLLAGDITLFVGHRIANLAHPVDAVFTPLGLTRDGYFVAATHPLRTAARRKTEVLAYPTTLAFPPEGRLGRLVTADGSSGRPPGSGGHGFTCSSLEACVAFARQTEAVLIHTDLMAPHFAAQGLLPVDMLPGEAPRLWPMGIYVLRERHGDPRVQTLVAEIVTAAAVLNLPPVRD